MVQQASCLHSYCAASAHIKPVSHLPRTEGQLSMQNFVRSIGWNSYNFPCFSIYMLRHSHVTGLLPRELG